MGRLDPTQLNRAWLLTWCHLTFAPNSVRDGHGDRWNVQLQFHFGVLHGTTAPAGHHPATHAYTVTEPATRWDRVRLRTAMPVEKETTWNADCR